jgi:hypothetical protein
LHPAGRFRRERLDVEVHHLQTERAGAQRTTWGPLGAPLTRLPPRPSREMRIRIIDLPSWS